MAVDCDKICEAINQTVCRQTEVDAVCPKPDVITEEEQNRFSDLRTSLADQLKELKDTYAMF